MMNETRSPGNGSSSPNAPRGNVARDDRDDQDPRYGSASNQRFDEQQPRSTTRHDLLVVHVNHAEDRVRDVQAYADILLIGVFRAYFHLDGHAVLPPSSTVVFARYNLRVAQETGMRPFGIFDSIPELSSSSSSSSSDEDESTNDDGWIWEEPQLQQHQQQQQQQRRPSNDEGEELLARDSAGRESCCDNGSWGCRCNAHHRSTSSRRRTDGGNHPPAARRRSRQPEARRSSVPSSDELRFRPSFWPTYDQLERETHRLIVGTEPEVVDASSPTLRDRVSYELHRLNGSCLTTVFTVTLDAARDSSLLDPSRVVFPSADHGPRVRVNVITGAPSADLADARRRPSPSFDDFDGPINVCDWPYVTNVRVVTPFANASFYSPVSLAETHEIVRLLLKRIEHFGLHDTRNMRSTVAVYDREYRRAALASVTGVPPITTMTAATNGNGGPRAAASCDIDDTRDRRQQQQPPRRRQRRASLTPWNPRYASFGSRLLSFDRWPPSIRQTAERMAEAGFYYRNRADIVRCFQCGCRLDRWLPLVDPWTRHAVASPHCFFVATARGISYVVTQRLLEARARLDVPNNRYRRYAVNEASDPDDELAWAHRHSLATSMVSQTRAMEVDLLAARGERHRPVDHGNDDDDNVVHGERSRVGRSSDVRDDERNEAERSVAPAASAGPVPSSNDDDDDDDDSSSSTASSSLYSDEEKRRAADDADDGTRVSSNRRRQKRKASARDKGRDDKYEATRDDDPSLVAPVCRVCMSSDIEVVFLPCGHAATCLSCAKRLRTCAICRGPVRYAPRIYFA
ncbi:unnamed protein product [Xylocopa violacea]|uniref:RING-type domain-containing protein n=1 Tax=Xylocopa violacea TaxID=135666 RepID=A0ABP1MVH6_XYLVO